MKPGLRKLATGAAALLLICGVLIVCAQARNLGLALGLYIGSQYGFSMVGVVGAVLMLGISYLGFVVGMSLGRKKAR